MGSTVSHWNVVLVPEVKSCKSVLKCLDHSSKFKVLWLLQSLNPTGCVHAHALCTVILVHVQSLVHAVPTVSGVALYVCVYTDTSHTPN